MENKKDSVIFYQSQTEICKRHLTAEQFGRLMYALFAFSEGEDPEVEEDIASQIIPEKGKRITDENPFSPDRLEHVSEKSLRQQKKEDRQAQQAKEIENLLDLRDI